MDISMDISTKAYIFNTFYSLFEYCGNIEVKYVREQLYGIVVRAPDSGLRGCRFESRTRRIFHDLGKVSEY
jgi:hypothetical protein